MNQKEIDQINFREVRRNDKFFRMFANLSSSLESFENGCIQLRIVNNETQILNTFNTACEFAFSWKNNNHELQEADRFVVRFFRTDGLQGGIIKDFSTVGLEKLVTAIKAESKEVPFAVFYGVFDSKNACNKKDLVVEKTNTNRNINVELVKENGQRITESFKVHHLENNTLDLNNLLEVSDKWVVKSDPTLVNTIFNFNTMKSCVLLESDNGKDVVGASIFYNEWKGPFQHLTNRKEFLLIAEDSLENLGVLKTKIVEYKLE